MNEKIVIKLENMFEPDTLQRFICSSEICCEMHKSFCKYSKTYDIIVPQFMSMSSIFTEVSVLSSLIC